MPGPDFHARAHRPNSTDPIPVLLHVLTFGDTAAITTGDGARTISITDDLGGTFLRSAHASIVTAGASALEIMVRNVTEALDMLADPITVDAGDTDSYASASPSAPDTSGTPANNKVSRGDQIAIDVDSASGTGLTVLLEFGPQIIRVTAGT